MSVTLYVLNSMQPSSIILYSTEVGQTATCVNGSPYTACDIFREMYGSLWDARRHGHHEHSARQTPNTFTTHVRESVAK